jgi:phosphatidylserine/phosphatidylglycerophosphate/cardiolipin synthase-like enzyme
MKKKQQPKKKTERSPVESHTNNWREMRLLILGSVLALIIYLFVRDWEFSRIVKNERPIEYTLISKKAQYGHNPSYSIQVYYGHAYYPAQISKREFNALKENIRPKLYYSVRYDEVFTLGEKTIMLKMSVFISVVSLLGYWCFARYSMGDEPRISDFKDWRKFI